MKIFLIAIDGSYGAECKRIWATDYEDDDEAGNVWIDSNGFPVDSYSHIG